MARPISVFEPPSFRRLHPVGALARLPQFADLVMTLSAHRIRVRYKQSRLGVLWAMLQPLAMMIVFSLMFSLLRAAPSQGVPYPLFAYAALMPWMMFSSGLSAASGSLTSHATLVTKIYFPREILPVTYVVAALADLAVASLALIALMLWYGVRLTPLALWALVAIILLTALLIGAGLLLSALQVRHRDVGLAMPVILQVWLFASPVLYPLTMVRRALPDPLYTLYTMNPMAGIIDTFRSAVVLHQAPDLHALGTAVLVTMALLPAAYIYFKYAELTMADVV
jgi:lipopolysaccharide transport system permease protein